MAAPAYTIRPMHRSDLDLVVDWAAAEGWNPGLHDADCFYAADPQGFLIGLLDGTPIASISAVKYEPSFGFLGFYIVQPGFRGCGYGWQIWTAGLTYLKGCTIGLDGVLAQQDNYRKSGFQFAYRNIRFEGISPGHRAPANAPLIPLSALPIETILQYDRLFFPGARAQFLTRWLTQPESQAIGVLHQQTLAGYGVLRKCRHGYKIGPLVADTPQVAEDLFLALTATVTAGNPFYLDVPECNPQAMVLAQRHRLQAMFETARMYTGEPPTLPLDRLYGVTSFELG